MIQLEGMYMWVAGPEKGKTIAEVGYSNWNANEPNNSGNEDCVFGHTNDMWNDANCATNTPYVIEYECASGCQMSSTGCGKLLHFVLTRILMNPLLARLCSQLL